ncbi:MAG: protease modulator HflC [Candidatus Brocadiia bacterium]
MKENKVTIAVVLIVLVLLLAYGFVYQVPETKMVVHYRPPKTLYKVRNAGQGEKGPYEGGPGLYFRFPYPIDEVQEYDKRVRVIDGPLNQTVLEDEWHVIISIYAAWRIKDPLAFEESLEGDVRRAEDRLKDVIYNETSEAIGQLRFNQLVSTNEEKVQLQALEAGVQAGARQAIGQKNYGIELLHFGIRRIAIPESTTQKVFERMKAERQKVADRFRNQGETEEKEIVSEAKKKAEKILADARSRAEEIRSEGEAKEAEYYDKFAQHPELAIFLRRLDALRTIARKARESGTPISYVLDTKTEPLGALHRGPQERETLEGPLGDEGVVPDEETGVENESEKPETTPPTEK